MAVRLPPVNGGNTLAERAYVAIKEAILELTLEPGAALVEDDLAQQLGTSKTPVRDALMALEREGLVVRVPYKGTYVAEISLRDITEIFELRSVLEGLAGRLAARAFTPAELDEAQAILDEADQAGARGDFQTASALGARFHKAIHRHADNRRLMPILENLDDQLRRLRRLSNQGANRLDESGHQHRRVLNALRAGDPPAAERAMREHLESVLRDLARDSARQLPARVNGEEPRM